MSRFLAPSLLLLAAATLAGCGTLTTPPVEMHTGAAPGGDAQAPAFTPAPAAPTAGAIYQAGGHRPLFEDRRARAVGDTLTILIEEQVSASQQSTSQLDRNGSVSATTSAVPWASARLLGRLGVDAGSQVGSNADGKTGSTNSFSGTITVQVRQVLPTGQLVVAGDKQIGVNQNVDVLRFSGTVDPRTIAPGNTVLSTQIANTRVESRGRGAQFDAQTFGWLSRFFLTLMPF